MRASQYLFRTLRDAPAEAQAEGHALLLRGGYVRPLAAGLFSFTPLGLRVKQRIEGILREEMDALGAHEVSMPVVQPAEVWRESGRWNEVGDEMARFHDRSGRELCLAMTHEEAATHLARDLVSSYRQLPLALYQLQTKFRDEPRARGGLLRTREFTMKDAYSFHADQQDLDAFYERVHRAYERIFERCGLDVVAVESDQGMMGGSGAHEFMALLPVGEDSILTCPGCGYRANRQVARFRKGEPAAREPEPLQEVATPGASTIAELTAFLGIAASETAKAVFLVAELEDAERLVFAVVRGDMELNETKLANLLGARSLRRATDEEIRKVSAEPGYASPVGVAAEGLTVVADDAVAAAPSLVAGANRAGYHLSGVRYGRDFTADMVADIAAAAAGAACAACGSPLQEARGVEVGNIFKLGTRYSASMSAGFLDERGEHKPFVMGSYGIGPGRLMACIAQVHRDERGLIWPAAVAPFDVTMVSVANAKSPDVASVAEALHEDLTRAGLGVLWDDRDERAGVKFADADLVGAPLRITVGAAGAAEGWVELKARTEPQAARVPLKDVVRTLRGALGAESTGPG